MKKLSILLLALASMVGVTSCAPEAPRHRNAAEIAALIRNPKTDQVLVASHRGDWRNFPENSIPAINSAIDMGVDIIELDLKMTADSVLVLMHDARIDRTTSGKGRVSEITYDSICKVTLRAGQGIATDWKVPTFEEALVACKDRAVVNIDQGFQYYDLIHPILERNGMLEQALIKGRVTAQEAEATFSKYEKNCLFMPIVNFGKKHYDEVLESYRDAVPLAYEVCWQELTPDVEACMQGILASDSKLWVNSLWPSLNGGLCDDAAVTGDAAGIYGALLDLGATIIQTDRPALLIDYLSQRGLH